MYEFVFVHLLWIFLNFNALRKKTFFKISMELFDIYRISPVVTIKFAMNPDLIDFIVSSVCRQNYLNSYRKFKQIKKSSIKYSDDIINW